MPGTDGLAALEALSDDERPAVVFTTAHDEHALRAFEENAVDYLLKPFDDERFGVALTRVKERVRNDELVRMGEDVLNLVEADNGFGQQMGADAPLLVLRQVDKARFLILQ